MNIDYNQILKNATTRQEALELLELNLHELDAIRTHLTAARVRLNDICEAHKALDAEGKNLLGGLKNMLDFAGNNVELINDAQVFVENLIEYIDANKES